MKIKTDLHTHSLVSVHAYSTIMEIAKYASENGITDVAITDHGPDILDGAHFWHFWNLNILPQYIYNVRILRGIELNILDESGAVDAGVPDFLYKNTFQWTIASIHDEAFAIKDTAITGFDGVTNAYLKILDNPYIDCIGHSGNSKYPYDYDAVIKKAAKTGKVIEINNNSFLIREGTVKNCSLIAKKCKEYGAKIAVNSDSHFAMNICQTEIATKMLEKINFPEELIINRDTASIDQYLEQRAKRIDRYKKTCDD